MKEATGRRLVSAADTWFAKGVVELLAHALPALDAALPNGGFGPRWTTPRRALSTAEGTSAAR